MKDVVINARFKRPGVEGVVVDHHAMDIATVPGVGMRPGVPCATFDDIDGLSDFVLRMLVSPETVPVIPIRDETNRSRFWGI